MTKVTINGVEYSFDGPVSISSNKGEVIINSTSVGNFAGQVATIKVDGDVLKDVTSDGPIEVNGNVGGQVRAGTGVRCGNIGGDVQAGTGATCGHVVGNVKAGTGVVCGDIGGNVQAGTSVIRK